MRVTNQSVLSNSIRNLQTNLQAMERSNEDISSGLRLRKMSQDPASGSEVIRIGSSMRAIEQFRRNIRTGTARVDAEEAALGNLTNTLGRSLELAISQASSTANAETRLITKAEVDSLIEYAVGQANTRVGDVFIFAGTRGLEAPFKSPTPAGEFRALTDSLGDPVDPSGTIPIEIADGQFVNPNSTGTEAFLETNALASLRALSEALGANDVAGITGAIDSLRNSVSDVQALVGRQGARANDLLNAETTLGTLELNLQAFRSDLRDTEIDKAMVELVGRQTLYQAAMSATSRVLGLSLANYL